MHKFILTCVTALFMVNPVMAQSAEVTEAAPEQTDAEPGYWTNLFENTIRYTISGGGARQDIDVYFNRDGTVSSHAHHTGQWRVEGEPGSEDFCYNLDGVDGEVSELHQCFALRFMNRPRIGARWGGTFEEGHRYMAVVVEGRNGPIE